MEPTWRSSLPFTQATKIGPNQKKALGLVLKELFDQRDSDTFRVAVDPKDVPNYDAIIKYPMDLSLVRKKLAQQRYENVEDCLDDIQIVFDNCKNFNGAENAYYHLALRFEQHFQSSVKNHLGYLDIQFPKLDQQRQDSEKPELLENPIPPNYLSLYEKNCFSRRLRALLPNQLVLVLEKLIADDPDCISAHDKGLMVDMDKINHKIARNIDVLMYEQLLSPESVIIERERLARIEK